MTWILAIIIILLCLFFFLSWRNKRKIIKLFDQGNVCVTGLRGTGKDMLFCIVINARKKDYISNVRYSDEKKKFKMYDLNTQLWDMNGNTHENFINRNIKHYEYPMEDNIDYYISDCGVYFPSTYHSELVKKYKSAPLFQALSRHLGECNIHCNAQRLNRIWDKIREQSDIYIGMKNCKCIFRRVFISGYIYQTEEACNKLLIPPKRSLFGKARIEQENIYATMNGQIKHFWFITKIPYKYDSRRFKTLLKEAK